MKVNTHSENVLIQSAMYADILGVAKLLVGGVNPNCRDAEGMTPLMIASVGNHGIIIALLILAGADVNAVGPVGMTPLAMARANRGSSEAEAMLVLGGAE